jgi:hypothetical protein
LEDVVDGGDHFGLPRLGILLGVIGVTHLGGVVVSILIVLLLLKAFYVVVQGVDVTIRHHAIHCLVVVVAVGWVVFELELAKFVEDSQLQAVFFEEGHDVLDGQTLLDVLLCFAYGPQDA